MIIMLFTLPTPSLRGLFNRPLDSLRDERRERLDVITDARRFQRLHVFRTVFNADDRPRISAGCHHEIHQEASHAAVPIHIRMDVHEYEVTEHDPHCAKPQP